MSTSAHKPSFSGHGTFVMRHGWLYKACHSVSKYMDTPESLKPSALDPFASEDAIVDFGVGKNMVQAIRYWSIATGVLRRAERGQVELTDFGKRLFISEPPLDRFMERVGTIWLLHAEVACNPQNTTIYELFNSYSANRFSHLEVENWMQEYAETHGANVSSNTLRRDIDCVLRSYLSPDTAEGYMLEGRDCPFVELGLIKKYASKDDTFVLEQGEKPSLPDQVFLYVLLNFIAKRENMNSTLSLGEIMNAPRSPGRIFLLDELSCVRRLEHVASLSNGILNWSESSGIMQLSISSQESWIDAKQTREGLLSQASSVINRYYSI